MEHIQRARVERDMWGRDEGSKREEIGKDTFNNYIVLYNSTV